ncbi:MAG: EFR1 family ferrodoxin [Methanoregula sp.]|nr:EFR1 family ferrodoxin [Methanoregula sp.]
MNTVIYYFTGTGNSLAAAKKIAALLKDCELVPIASLQDTPGQITPVADRVGIVCPVYDAGIPVIVAEFAGRLTLSRAGYVFGIVTMARFGVSALHQLNRIFHKRQGRDLDAAFAVVMPGNFPPVGKSCRVEPGHPVLTAADARLAEIAGMIDKGLIAPPGFSPLSSLIHLLSYGSFSRSVRGSDRAFSVSEACTSCGTCVKVCPVENLMMVRDRPSWLHHCECCCACLHFCPAEAIQLNVMQGTKGRGRYRHPDLKIEDMKVQRGE